MANLVIHTATGVCKWLTGDAVVAPDDHEIRVVPNNFDMSNGPWKVDAQNNKSRPTEQELETAFTRAARGELADVIQRSRAVALDETLPNKVRLQAAAIAQLLTPKRSAE